MTRKELVCMMAASIMSGDSCPIWRALQVAELTVKEYEEKNPEPQQA